MTGLDSSTRSSEVGYFVQAQKALADRSPHDDEETVARVPTLPVSCSLFLSRFAESRSKHKKSHSDSAGTPQPRSRFSNIWTNTEDYFRPVTLTDIELLLSKSRAASFDPCLRIPVLPCGNFTMEPSSSINRTTKEPRGREKAGTDVDGLFEPMPSRAEKNSVSISALVGLQWLMGCRNKVLIPEQPSNKRKLSRQDAASERLIAIGGPTKGQNIPCNLTLCDVCCLRDVGDKTDSLLQCDLCGVQVHQKCYGAQGIQEARWVCSWCKKEHAIKERPCVLCPREGGALKPVSGGSYLHGKFAHLACCLWIPEVYVESTKEMEPVVNIEAIKETRWKSICCLCKIKYGACIKCSQGACKTTFHPVCAREAKHKMEIWGNVEHGNIELRTFCSKHSAYPDTSETQTSENIVSVVDDSQHARGHRFKELKLFNFPYVVPILKKLVDQGKINLSNLARETGISSDSLTEALKGDLNFVPYYWKLKIATWLWVRQKGAEDCHVDVNANQQSGTSVDEQVENVDACTSIRSLDGEILEQSSMRKIAGITPYQLLDSSSIASFFNDGLVEWRSSPVVSSPRSKYGGIEEFVDAEIQPVMYFDMEGSGRCQQAFYLSYIHPLVTRRLSEAQNCQIDGATDSFYSENVWGNIHPRNDCASTNVNDDGTRYGNQFARARSDILNISPEDEVEGEILYLQKRLLDQALTVKRNCDDVIFRVVTNLPHELEALREQSWNALLVSHYLCEVKEARKRGQRERRHREAQAVLAAATAAAAASSRVSRKDAQSETVVSQHMSPEKWHSSRAVDRSPQLILLPKEKILNMESSIVPVPCDGSLAVQCCDICRRGEKVLKPIYVCSECKVAVHLDCYRSYENPVGQWYCESCEELQLQSHSPGLLSSNINQRACCFCGGQTGAFKKSADGRWFHVFCAEWLLEFPFDRGQVNAATTLEFLPWNRVVCCVCHQKVGACLKCSYGHCQSMFHPTCARNSAFYMIVKTWGDKVQHKAYCGRHSVEQREKGEAQRLGLEELWRIRQTRVELEKMRLLCERIIKREKMKKELILCSHEILASRRDLVAFSALVRSVLPASDTTSESVTTSLKGLPSDKFCSSRQWSEEMTVDSVAFHKLSSSLACQSDIDQRTDDSSTSQQLLIVAPTDRTSSSGKRICRKPTSVPSWQPGEGVERSSRSGKHVESFKEELVMTSDQTSMQNQRLPKGFAFVPVRYLSKEKPD